MSDENSKKNSPPRRAKKDEESTAKAVSASYLSDFKLTILSNAILLAVIAYLLLQLYEEKVYTDCGDYFRKGFRDDGVYEIRPVARDERRFNVYCNMTAGGWTAIMRRELASKYAVDFHVGIDAYRHGFGVLTGDHFLGLDNMHVLTHAKSRQLMVILNETEYRYTHFRVLNQYYHYKLIVEDELDRNADGTTILRLNNTLFSAIDVDYDLAANSNCSSGWKAGWWFTDCFDHSTCITCMIAHGNLGVKKLSFGAMLVK